MHLIIALILKIELFFLGIKIFFMNSFLKSNHFFIDYLILFELIKLNKSYQNPRTFKFFKVNLWNQI
jgi:hypothetical protein